MRRCLAVESLLYRGMLTCCLAGRATSFFIRRKACFSTKKELQRIWTIPNAISASRIIMTPLIGHAVLTDRPATAMSLFVVSAVSDFADGYFARRFNQQSALGS